MEKTPTEKKMILITGNPKEKNDVGNVLEVHHENGTSYFVKEGNRTSEYLKTIALPVTLHRSGGYVSVISNEKICVGMVVRHSNDDIGLVTKLYENNTYDMLLLSTGKIVTNMRIVNARRIAASNDPKLVEAGVLKLESFPNEESDKEKLDRINKVKELGEQMAAPIIKKMKEESKGTISQEEKTWWQKLGIKFDGKWYDGKWYTHPKTNTYDNLGQVIVELNNWKPSGIVTDELPSAPQPSADRESEEILADKWMENNTTANPWYPYEAVVQLLAQYKTHHPVVDAKPDVSDDIKKVMEDAYELATLQSLGASSTETRMDVIYRAMEIYKDCCLKKLYPVKPDVQEGEKKFTLEQVRESFIAGQTIKDAHLVNETTLAINIKPKWSLKEYLQSLNDKTN